MQIFSSSVSYCETGGRDTRNTRKTQKLGESVSVEDAAGHRQQKECLDKVEKITDSPKAVL